MEVFNLLRLNSKECESGMMEGNGAGRGARRSKVNVLSKMSLVLCYFLMSRGWNTMSHSLTGLSFSCNDQASKIYRACFTEFGQRLWEVSSKTYKKFNINISPRFVKFESEYESYESL